MPEEVFHPVVYVFFIVSKWPTPTYHRVRLQFVIGNSVDEQTKKFTRDFIGKMHEKLLPGNRFPSGACPPLISAPLLKMQPSDEVGII